MALGPFLLCSVFAFLLRINFCTSVVISPLSPSNFASVTYDNRIVGVDTATDSWFINDKPTDWAMQLSLSSNLYGFQDTVTELTIIMNGVKVTTELDMFYAFSVNGKYFTFANDFDGILIVYQESKGAFIYPSCGSSLISGNASALWVDYDITSANEQRNGLAGGNASQWTTASITQNGNKWPLYFTFINDPQNNTFTFKAKTESIDVECKYASAFDINSDFSMYFATDMGNVKIEECSIYSFTINITSIAVSTSDPTIDPSNDPTADPSNSPSDVPSIGPNNSPSSSPTLHPLSPSSYPTVQPSQLYLNTNEPTKNTAQESESSTFLASNSFEFIIVFIAVSVVCTLVIGSGAIFLCLKKRNRMLERYENQVSNFIASKEKKIDLTEVMNIQTQAFQTQMAITNFQMMQAMQIHSNQNMIVQPNINQSNRNMGIVNTNDVDINIYANRGLPAVSDIQVQEMNVTHINQDISNSTVVDSESENSFVSISSSEKSYGGVTQGNTPFVEEQECDEVTQS